MPSRAGPPPSRRAVAALLAAAALLACSAPRPAPPSGASTGWIGPGDRDAAPGAPSGAPGASAPPPHADPPAPPPTPWELAPEISTFAVAAPRGRSQHFTGELEAEVRANAAAAGYPALRGDRPLPPGAVLLEPHYPPGSAEAIALLAMVKRPPGYDPAAGDWEYLILTPTGEATHRGRLALCQRCHAEAPHDHLFGGPR